MQTIITVPTDDRWFVVFLSFCQNIVKEAVPYTYLILILQNDGDKDIYINFLAGGLFFGFTLILTPLSCALVNWRSFKFLNTLGPVLLVISMVSSHFILINDLDVYLFCSFSLIGGFGNSMLHVGTKLMPSYWFCNRRGLAHSIAYSGHPVGFLLVTGFFYLLQWKVFQHRLFIFSFLSGFYVPLILLGLLTPEEETVVITYKGEEERSRQPHLSGSKVRFKDEVEAKEMAQTLGSYLNRRLSYQIFKVHHNLIYPRVKDIIGANEITLYAPSLNTGLSLNKPWPDGWQYLPGPSSELSWTVGGRQKVRLIVQDTGHLGSRPMYRTDIFYTWNIFELPIYYRQDNQLDFHMAVTRAMTSNDLNQEITRTWKRCIIPESMMRTLLTMLDYNIYFDFYMILLHISIFLMAAGQIIPIVFISCRGKEIELDTYFALVFTGAGQLIGRIIVMLLSFFSSGTFNYSSNITLFLFGGAITIIAGFLTLDLLLVCYAFMYGMVHALTQSIRLSAVYTISKLHDLTNVNGWALIWQGSGYSASIAFSGYLYLKYDKAFWVLWYSGGAMITAGMLLLLTRIIQSWKLRSLVMPT